VARNPTWWIPVFRQPACFLMDASLADPLMESFA
jgi:hypothetical protein